MWPRGILTLSTFRGPCAILTRSLAEYRHSGIAANHLIRSTPTSFPAFRAWLLVKSKSAAHLGSYRTEKLTVILSRSMSDDKRSNPLARPFGPSKNQNSTWSERIRMFMVMCACWSQACCMGKSLYIILVDELQTIRASGNSWARRLSLIARRGGCRIWLQCRRLSKTSC